MKKTIIFVVTNGAGLGHLTRGLAVAKRMRRLEPEIEVVFLSTSLGLEIIRNEGFMFYYIPTRGIMPELMTPSLWNNYMKSHLKEIIQIYNPVALVFDGAYPYGGVVANIRMEYNMKSFWIKRETYKQEVDQSEKLEAFFDYIIVPKEAGKKYEKSEGEKKWYCDPILFIEEEESYPRSELRKAWGINEGEKVVYVQLGAGNINEIGSEIHLILEGILTNERNRVLLGESIIGRSLGIKKERVSVIREYPNARYFKGIDYAVSAVGYNSYQELMYFNVPTLFVPNRHTVKDDQKARAMLAHQRGAGICVDKVTKESVIEGLNYLALHESQIRFNAKKMLEKNGAKDAAQFILERV